MVAIGCFFAFIIVVIAAEDLSESYKQSFAENMLYSHNKYRKIHGAPELFLSPKMCKMANNLLIKWTDQPESMKIPETYGSNTFTINYVDNYILNAYKIFDNWYNYNTVYDYFYEPLNSNATDPFTQIVWQRTKKIGVGVSLNDGVFKVLVIYSPAGNQIGHYMSNVQDPRVVTGRLVPLNDTEKQWFSEQILDTHNIYRKYHNSPDLILSNQLSGIANTYLIQWMENRPITLLSDLGINISQTPFESKPDVKPKRIVRSWYKNQIFYDYKNEYPTDPDLTNPFTQIVWQSTQEIGVGILILNNQVNVVVLYSPPGNQPGQYTSNVYGLSNIAEEDRIYFHNLMV